ncbi:hypothetical protein MO867_07645 [Microbulbifer sp. OS29]|uniref:Uncharacterized protein n=1 Tax=Microbulbifer okhotskensis TaxID=2926617 RepID=A0A9X2J633_9GAMM|nr:hypothetical protein [Microbulbifer okhotskensis]MCO1334215.1 hypothetical protein [Microbulbifer okhotskensis]
MQKPHMWLGCALATILINFSAISQTTLAGDRDIRLTNPDTLESMGFERDEDNVYIAEGVYLEKPLDSSFYPSGGPDAQEGLFPSGSTDYSPITPKAFIGRQDTTGSQWLYSSGNGIELSRLGTELFADAQFLDLPNGGTLEFFRWWWSDNDPNSAMATFLFEVCQPAFAPGAITFTLVTNSTSTDAANGSAAVNIPSRPIDTQSCYYLARVRFDAATTLLRLQKVRLQFIHP